jgi:IS30 family transposase
MPAEPLTASEREEIRAGIERAESTIVIADRLGRHRSTISREVARNGGRCRYEAVAAQRRAERKVRRPKVPKLVADPDLAVEVSSRLEAKDSPMRISIELTAAGRPISHECIYTAIRTKGWGLAWGLWKHLHLGRKRRKRRGQRRSNTTSLGIYCSIHDRPRAAWDRSEPGHLEGDLIVGAYNRSALITLFERTTRHLWLAEVAAKTADAVYDALITTFQRIPPPLRVTLAWDQGAEIAHHARIALETGTDIYIADPKSPWQRPTNENGNALVRRYVGKGTDLSVFTPADLRAIETRINTIPRRTLNWATAHDTYHAAVAMTG